MKKLFIPGHKEEVPISSHQKLSFEVLASAAWINSQYSVFFKKHKLSFQQYWVLRVLYDHHPQTMSIKMLSQKMIDRNSNVSRLMVRLCDKGLTVRAINEEDRRQTDAKIPHKGIQLLKNIAPLVDGLFRAQGELSEEEAQQSIEWHQRFRQKK